jgi:hypothetical protein
MIKLDDFKRDNGDLDWAAYKQAQVSAGEICFKCRDSIYKNHGHASLCSSCEQMSVPNKDIYHNHFIRCPHCGQTQQPNWEYHYEEGLHDVNCKHCNKEYEFTTIIERSFLSVKMVVQSDIQDRREDEP